MILARKAVATLVALVAAAVMLCGCGNVSNAAKEDDKPKDTVSATSTNKDQTMNIESGDQAKQFEGKTWIVLGDSITEKTFRANKGYYDYVADELGCTVVNYGASGTGYKDAGPFEPFYERIPLMDFSNADCLTVFGSFNDLDKGYELGTANDETTDTIGGCMNITMQRLRDAKPTMAIGVATPTRWATGVALNKKWEIDWGGTTREECDAYVQLLKDVASRYGYPVLDLYEKYTVDPDNEEHQNLYFTEDGEKDIAFVHPNSEGHRLMAPLWSDFVTELMTSGDATV